MHIPKIGAYGYCDKNCPTSNRRHTRKQFSTRRKNNDNSGQCVTVSGPNPGKLRIFPFKFNGKTYNGCETDPDDRTKTWCSTKVDSRGNHITGQNEYGHCGINCPRHTVKNQALSKSFCAYKNCSKKH